MAPLSSSQLRAVAVVFTTPVESWDLLHIAIILDEAFEKFYSRKINFKNKKLKAFYYFLFFITGSF